MNRESYIRIISGETKGISSALCRASLSVLSSFYFFAWSTRETAIRLHVLPVRKVSARVVSIGNITAGGTGKTPAVIYFAARLRRDGAKLAIISRGYGRISPTDEPVVVSDAEGHLLVSPEISGDEPYLLARKLPGIPVIVCGNRVRSANLAIARFNAEVILLDDGFQHRMIARDEDIVLIDCSRPFGYDHLLPRGLLREPMWALKRATTFLLTRADECKHAHVVEKLKHINPSAEILLSRHRPVRLHRIRNGGALPCRFLNGRRVFAVSSIGNPSAFEHTLQKLRARVVGSLRFADHHWYSAGDIVRIQKEAARCEAEYIVSTEKDGIRFELLKEVPDNLLLLEVELEIIGTHPGA